MKRALKGRFERLGPIQDIDRVSSGLPETLVLRPASSLAKVKTISAIEALAKRGLTLLKAKRTIEAVVEQGESVVHVPMVENAKRFAADLLASGVRARRVAHEAVNVKAIRSALGMTQEQFARRYALDIDALQNWEQGRTQPDRTA